MHKTKRNNLIKKMARETSKSDLYGFINKRSIWEADHEMAAIAEEALFLKNKKIKEIRKARKNLVNTLSSYL